MLSIFALGVVGSAGLVLLFVAVMCLLLGIGSDQNASGCLIVLMFVGGIALFVIGSSSNP